MNIHLIPIIHSKQKGTILRIPARVQSGTGRRRRQMGTGIFEDIDDFLKTTHILSGVAGALGGVAGSAIGTAVGGPGVGTAVGGAVGSSLVGSAVAQTGYGKRRGRPRKTRKPRKRKAKK